MSQQESKVY